MSCNFNPRSPRGERLEMFENVAYLLAFQSTFPSRGTTLDFLRQHGVLSISIHVPLAGNDFFGHAFTSLSKISIHVPLAGNDVIRLLSEEFVDEILLSFPGQFWCLGNRDGSARMGDTGFLNLKYFEFH